MKILADQNMPLIEDFFGPLGNVSRFDGRTLTPEQLHDVDVLLIRSVTRIDEAMLARANKLCFIGTATIGVDHVDTAFLKQKGIVFSSAPGCNSVAVAEYVISALFALSQQDDFVLTEKTIGIVGVGSIGQCLSVKLKALGIKLLLCDPPREREGSLAQHTDIDTLLSESDIVSFHVPLVKEGPDATRHLLSAERLALMKEGAVLINASRGDVIDNRALLTRMQNGAKLELVLDVWENEPDILTELMDYVRIASVHIAGHSLEGKARGTEMLYQALCETLEVEASLGLSDFLPAPEFGSIMLSETANHEDIGRLCHLVYDVRRDDGLMRSRLQKEGFDALRKNYPGRREFSTLTVSGAQALDPALEGLGFTVSE